MAKKYSIYFFALFSILPIIQASFTAILSGDIYWHLKMGEDFLFAGLNPYIDHYSVDFNGSPLKNFSILFDSCAAIFYRFFGGEKGLQYFRFLLISMPLSFIFLLCLRKKYHGLIFLLVASFLVLGITSRNLIRPELISYIFTAYFMWVLLEKKYDKKTLLILLLLNIIWGHFHSTSVFAYVIFAGIYLEAFLEKLKAKAPSTDFFKLLGLGALTFLSGFLNFNFHHPLIDIFYFNPEWENWIIEFFPVPLLHRKWQLQYIFIVSTLLIVFTLLKKRWGVALVLSVFTLQNYSMLKMTPHLTVVSAMVILYLCSEYQKKIFSQQSIRKHLIYASILVLMALNTSTSLGLLINQPLISKKQNRAHILPTDIIARIKKDHPKNILNNYLMGGYLLYHLGPQIKIRIDGRTNILYPFDYFLKTSEAYADMQKFNTLIDLDQYEGVVGPLHTSQGLIDTALESGKFGLSYITAFNAYLKPIAQSQYPVSSLYFRFPQCYKDLNYNKVMVEARAATKDLPKDSQLRVLHAIIYRYNAARSKIDYLNEVLKGPELYYSSYRFAAYQAIQLKQPELALKLFLRSRADYKPRDLIHMVDILCKIKNCKGAQQLFTLNIDRVMPTWQRQELLRQLSVLREHLGIHFKLDFAKEKIGKNFTASSASAEFDFGLDPCP